MGCGRNGECRMSPLLPPPLKVSPQVPLYFKGIVNSVAFFLLTPCGLWQKNKNSENNVQGKGSKRSCRRHLEEPLLFFLDSSWAEPCSSPIFLSSSAPWVPSIPSALLFEPFLAIDLQRNAKAFWHRMSTDASEKQAGGCRELGPPGEHGAAAQLPVTCVNGALGTGTQRHASLVVPPVNHMYVCRENPLHLISSLVPICLFILRLLAPCSKNSHFLKVK